MLHTRNNTWADIKDPHVRVITRAGDPVEQREIWSKGAYLGNLLTHPISADTPTPEFVGHYGYRLDTPFGEIFCQWVPRGQFTSADKAMLMRIVPKLHDRGVGYVKIVSHGSLVPEGATV